jgi:hypothetical protein
VELTKNNYNFSYHIFQILDIQTGASLFGNAYHLQLVQPVNINEQRRDYGKPAGTVENDGQLCLGTSAADSAGRDRGLADGAFERHSVYQTLALIVSGFGQTQGSNG